MKNILTEHKWLAYALIALAGYFLYQQVLAFDLTYFDDNGLILEKLSFLKDPANIIRAFRQDVFSKPDSLTVFYRPLLTVSFMLDTMMDGTSPFMYHFTNIILHILASCLVYYLLLKLKISRDASLALSLVFTVHPLLAQAVAWIPGRNDSLLAVFTLSSFLSFVKFRETGKAGYCALHLLLFLCALFTKETAVMLPVVCVLYAHMERSDRAVSTKIYAIAGWAFAVALWLFARRAAIGDAADINIADAARSIALNAAAAFGYMGKMFFPVNIAVFPVMRDIPPVYGISATALFAAALAATKDKDNRLVMFGISWFALFLLPAFFRPIPDIVAPHLDFSEHRVYLPMIGIVMAVSQIGPVRRFDMTKIPHAAAAIMIIAIFSAISFRQTGPFKDRTSFAEKAVASSPHAAWARVNLGTAYYLEGDTSKAESEFKKALELNPQQPMAHTKLGLIYSGRGLTETAEREFKKEIAINPLYEGSWVALGTVYYKKGRPAEAERAWFTAIEVNPSSFDARKNLAIFHKERGETAKSVRYVRELQKMGVPVPPDFLASLGLTE